MATTYTLISSVTVGAGGAADITFSSIPQTYTDLVLKLSTRGTAADDRRQLLISYNGSTSSFTGIRLYGEDNITDSDSLSGASGYSIGITNAANSTASTFGNAEIYIPNYSGSNNKSSSTDSVFEQNSSTRYDLWMTATLWSNSSAITSIAITISSGSNIAQYSTAYLYGISNA
jgi:hypothetical protein